MMNKEIAGKLRRLADDIDSGKVEIVSISEAIGEPLVGMQDGWVTLRDKGERKWIIEFKEVGLE